uniref:Transmembrane protein n=1 Tax=Cacopsylla melanoneura TaxID=428564 RepID=A0A8D8TAC0_9HEMI
MDWRRKKQREDEKTEENTLKRWQRMRCSEVERRCREWKDGYRVGRFGQRRSEKMSAAMLLLLLDLQTFHSHLFHSFLLLHSIFHSSPYFVFMLRFILIFLLFFSFLLGLGTVRSKSPASL